MEANFAWGPGSGRFWRRRGCVAPEFEAIEACGFAVSEVERRLEPWELRRLRGVASVDIPILAGALERRRAELAGLERMYGVAAALWGTGAEESAGVRVLAEGREPTAGDMAKLVLRISRVKGYIFGLENRICGLRWGVRMEVGDLMGLCCGEGA